MSGSVPWQILESQYLSYGQECKEEFDRLINSPEKIVSIVFIMNLNYNNFLSFQTFDKELVDAGKTFAKSFINFNNFLSDLNMSLSSYLEKLFSSTSFTSTSNSLRKTKLINETMLLKRNTFNFMRGIMDECTHLANFSPLVDPELAIIINARHDGYVPSHGVMPLTNIWPGSTVRYLNRGHVSAILLDNDVSRQAIADSLNLTASKYYGGSLFNGELNKTKKRA